jgi:high-affinity iron transporter
MVKEMVAPFKVIMIVIYSLITTAGPGWIVPSQVRGESNYKAMVEEIEMFFNESLLSYRSGDIENAKLKAQSAYFEVFENLEGPIRINISAKKNYELESEFVAIRKLIIQGEPFEKVEARIHALLVELRKTQQELEGGFQLVSEPAWGEENDRLEGEGTDGKSIELVWQRALDNIQSKLDQAIAIYKPEEETEAKTMVLRAQFDGYKNTLLETAIRRHVSQGKDFENNAAFSEIIGMIDNGAPVTRIEQRVAVLIASLREDLAGLPAFEGVAAPKTEKRDITAKNWNQVKSDILVALQKAIYLNETGDKKGGIGLVQDTYFDLFEASGMESKIGAMDAGMKAGLERQFSLLIGQMKANVSVEQLQSTLQTMTSDFDEAVQKLGQGTDSPTVLFFYSLMIILREGFEAILIITAIIAYLIKTGHQDKLGVIYNACMVALVLSVITAVLVKWVFNVSPASQEILEGVTMLVAAVVLFSVSYWLISKMEAKKWTAYIKKQVHKSLSSGSLKALWFTVFLAVYREGAETVLFYQALVIKATPLGITAVIGGFILGSILLVGIYLIMRYGSIKLPLRPFFLVTGGLLYYMAFVFTGQGIMELIEGKVLEPSLISWGVTVPLLGIYPYWQSLTPQFFLMLAAFLGIALLVKPRRELSHKS